MVSTFNNNTFIKIKKVIISCTKISHIESTRKLIRNAIAIENINNYLYTILMNLLYIKQKQLLKR